MKLDCGKRRSHDPTDHENSRTLILWGRNPAATQQPMLPILTRVREQGGDVLLVDPVFSETARRVDRHLQPRPGGDRWLALAVASHIFQQGWQDDDFLNGHTDNVASFRELVSRWSLGTLCQRAGISRDEVIYLADRLTRHRPVAILLGWGIHRWKGASDAIRMIDALSAITGNLGVPGGGVSQGFDEYGPYDERVRGKELCPERRRFSMPRIGEEIRCAGDPSIEMIFVTAGNPVNMAPDTGCVAKAFEQAPFVVYCGQFMDDTADRADLFLPVTTYLEEEDVVAGFGHDVVGPVNRVVAPVGEARTHFQIFAALARLLGIDDFEKGEDYWLRRLLTPLEPQGVTLEQIRKGPVRQGLPTVPFADGVFDTPSGRFQLITDVESEEDDGDAGQWPFALLSTSPRDHLCSERTPDDHDDLPRVTLSAGGAASRGLADGQRVVVRSPTGSLAARLVVDDRQRDDVAIVHRGGWGKLGHGVNRLTASHTSTLGEGAAYYETRVRVE